MLLRMAAMGLAAYLFVTEIALTDTSLNSELNWWTYVIRRDTGFEAIERALSDVNRR